MPYLLNASSFIADTVLGLYLIAVILRFLFQTLHVDFRNPVSQLVVALTNPPLKWLRRYIPGLYGIDLSSVVLMLVVGVAKTATLLLISGIPFSFAGSLVLSVAEVINITTWILIIVILVSAILSWVAPRNYNPVFRLVGEMSNPVLRPFRSILPAFGGLDLTPVLALLVLNLVQRLIVLPINDFGRSLFL